MSERDSYPAGVPCWVETLQRDPRRAQTFYAALFGWEMAGSGEYAVARMRGRDVAGIGALPDGTTEEAWITHVRVDSADDAARAAADAGGTVVRPPFDVDPAGRLAVVADPTGAVFCVWQAGIREGAGIVNEPGAWSMSALQTGDVDAAAAFYGAVFGWERDAFGPATLFRRPGYVGGEPGQPVARDVVAVAMPAAEGPARWAADFWVADAEAAAQRAAELGGAAVVAPFERPPFRSAVLADPAGATFSVSQLLGPPS